MTTQCLFCGQAVALVHVHGHYQCPVCNTNALPCCDADNCETNQLLKENGNTVMVNLQSESREQNG
jgi:hypothetical protein